MGYVVTAPLVIARGEDGADQYLYAGAPVPSSIKSAEVKRLLAEKMIGKVEDADAEAPAKAAPSKAAPSKAAPAKSTAPAAGSGGTE